MIEFLPTFRQAYYQITCQLVGHSQFLVSHYRTRVAFSDFENIVASFDASSLHNTDKWVTNFDDVTSMFNLSDLHKFIFAKKSP